MWEIGGDISRPLAEGAIKLVGLVNRQQRDGWRERYRFRTEGGDRGPRRLRADCRMRSATKRCCVSPGRGPICLASRSKRVSKACSTRWTRMSGCSSSSRAANRFRSTCRSNSATVKEKRAEAFINFGRQLSKSIRIDGGLTYEYSSIKVRGDTKADRILALLEAEPDARLEGRQGLAWAVIRQAHRRAAGFLRLHQLGRAFDRSRQCRQSRSGAAAGLGVSRHDRASAARRRRGQARRRL